MTITIRDIAKKLNLSIAAVSRALDGYDDISEETRLRVVQTAQKMGYVPNRAARQLRRQHRGEVVALDEIQLPAESADRSSRLSSPCSFFPWPSLSFKPRHPRRSTPAPC